MARVFPLCARENPCTFLEPYAKDGLFRQLKGTGDKESVGGDPGALAESGESGEGGVR